MSALHVWRMMDLRKRRVAAAFMAFAFAATSITPGTLWKHTSKVEASEIVADAQNVNGDSYGLASSIQQGTILHCFDWKYNDIKEELANIAEAGFTSVQTSPAQPSLANSNGDTWYWVYQPTGFSIASNQLGSKDDLKNLCTEAEKYGIKVVVDVVANHTAGQELGGGNYHNEGDATYGDRHGITHGKIGMPDLKSENTDVQNAVKNYISELKSVGVDGVRWDAAKHISLPSENYNDMQGCNFWPAVTESGLYNYGEILVGPTEGGKDDSHGASLMKEYTKYISVTDSRFSDMMLYSFQNHNIQGTGGYWTQAGVASDKLVYWAESHDTYSNDGEYGANTSVFDQNIIDRAYAMVAARAGASALYFSRPSEKSKQSIKLGQKGSTHFTSPEVAAVNKFHNAMAGSSKEYYLAEGNTEAVLRAGGAVLAMVNGGAQDVTISNGGSTVAPGTYTDMVSGGTFTVTADKISGHVGDKGIAVFYDGSKAPASSTTTVTDSPSTSVTAKENTITAVKPSGWSSMRIYAYEDGATAKKLTGEWPGTAMDKNSDGTYSYTFSSDVKSAKVIFNDNGGSQDPVNQVGRSCGYDYTSGKAFKYENGSFTEVKIVATTTATPKATEKATATPKPTEKATATPKPTEKATAAPTKAPTKAPTATPQVTIAPTAVPAENIKKGNYKITFELDGGYIEGAVSTSFTGRKMVALKNAVKEGYLFEGWYLDSAFTEKISIIPAGTYKDVTLYAKWKKVSKPAAVTISSAKSTAKRKLKVSLKSSVAGAVGYQYCLSTNAKFKSMKTTSNTSKTANFKGLSSKKKYYVKVRAYVVDSAGEKVYGSYSKVVTVKVK